jgi:DNA-binding XRE family transcriptional regulator
MTNDGAYIPRNAQQAEAMSWGRGTRVRTARTLTREEAAKALGVSIRTLTNMVDRGEIERLRSPYNALVTLFREQDVFNLAAARMVARGLKAAK